MKSTAKLHELRSGAPQPKTTTARKLARSLNDCIVTIKSYRDRALNFQDESPELIEKDLGDALLLQQILSDWECGNFSDHYPGEIDLIKAIRGNLEL